MTTLFKYGGKPEGLLLVSGPKGTLTFRRRGKLPERLTTASFPGDIVITIGNLKAARNLATAASLLVRKHEEILRRQIAK
jgi:hypothetical protein